MEPLTLQQPFEYEVIRSQRKTLSIEVHHQTVRVRAPKLAPKGWIDSFVQQKAPWIRRKLAEQAEKHANTLRLETGAVISFMGEQKTLVIKQGANRIHVTGEQLVISNANITAERIKAQFDRWLLNQAKHILPQRVEALAATIGFEKKLTGVRFRKTKTQWGHCTAKGVIQLNQSILLTPLEVIDYLIIHELSHLKYMNHSKRFWSLVEKNCPNYQAAEVWLKQHGHSVWYS